MSPSDTSPSSSRMGSSYFSRPLLAKKALNFTYMLTVINQTAMFIYISIMPYMFREYDLDPLHYGYIQSGHAFLQLITGPLLGQLSDISGSRVVLLIAMTSSTCALLLMGTATSLMWLVVSRVSSLCMDMLPGAMMTVTDLVADKDRGLALGRIMVPMSMGMITGPIIGGFLSQRIGYHATLLVSGTVTLGSIPVMTSYLPRRPADLKPGVQHNSKTDDASTPAARRGLKWENVKVLITNGDVIYLLLLRFLATLPGMLFMMNVAVAGIRVFHLTPQSNGLVFSCLGVINMFNNGIVLGMISKRSTPSTLLRFAAILSIAAYFLLGQTTDVWQLIVLLYPINLSYAILENQVMTRLTKSAPPKYTSTMLGLGTSLFHLSRTLAPSVGAMLMTSYGWSSIGYVSGVVSVVLLLLVMLWDSSPTPGAATDTTTANLQHQQHSKQQ